jgi:hypothetical protein
MVNNPTMPEVFPKLVGDELLTGKGFQKADAELQMMRQPLIIRIKKGQIRADAGAQAGVARAGRSLIFLPNEFQSRVAAFDLRRGVVGRSVVHDDQLPISECLRLNAPDGSLDGLSAIQRGHDYGNQGHILFSLFFF